MLKNNKSRGQGYAIEPSYPSPPQGRTRRAAREGGTACEAPEYIVVTGTLVPVGSATVCDRTKVPTNQSISIMLYYYQLNLKP